MAQLRVVMSGLFKGTVIFDHTSLFDAYLRPHIVTLEDTSPSIPF